MGHPGKEQLDRIIAAANIRGQYNAELCETCVMAKATSKPYSHKPRDKSEKQIRDTVSLDITGPIEKPGLDGERFLLVMAHHKTGATMAWPLKSKGEQDKIIMNTLEWLKNLGHPVVRVQCDNAAENVSAKLVERYEQMGIMLKTSNPHESNQNAVDRCYLGVDRTIKYKNGEEPTDKILLGRGCYYSRFIQVKVHAHSRANRGWDDKGSVTRRSEKTQGWYWFEAKEHKEQDCHKKCVYCEVRGPFVYCFILPEVNKPLFTWRPRPNKTNKV